MDLNRLKGYTTRQQKDLNLVRLYLQVTTLAELVDTTENGKIATWAFEGTRPTSFKDNKAWPRQEGLTHQQRRLWKKYISAHYLRYGRFWRLPPRPTLRDVKETCNTSNLAEGSTDINDKIMSFPRGRRRLLTHIRQHVSDDVLWEECQKKQTLTIATDGGLKGRKGTFGWLVSTPNETMLAEGAGPVDGPFDAANSTRCELGGYAASLLFISLLHNIWGKKHKCDFRWVTDSKAAMSKVAHQTTKSTKKMRQPSNADYLGIIQSETSSIRRRIRPVWVKGHQNTSRNGAQSKDIKRNNHVDQLATWYRNQQSYRQSVEHTDHIPEAKVTISVNGIRVVGQEEATLRYHINGYHLRQYIQSRQKWTNKIWNTIDIELFGLFYRKLHPRDQVAHTRFIFDQWHTGKQRQRINTTHGTNVDKCPCCLQTNETTTHVLRCTANPEHANTLSVFRTKMSPTEYHPVFSLLKEGVLSWFEGTPFSPDLTAHPKKFHDRIRQAIQDQEQIGWGNAIKGYLSVELNEFYCVCVILGYGQTKWGFSGLSL